MMPADSTKREQKKLETPRKSEFFQERMKLQNGFLSELRVHIINHIVPWLGKRFAKLQQWCMYCEGGGGKVGRVRVQSSSP